MTRFSEEWLQEYQAKQGRSLAEQQNEAHGIKPGKPQGGNLRLVLPFKLPTWNVLLAMNHWQRAKVRHWLHNAISACTPSVEDSQTLTVSQSRLASMGLSVEEYYRMIAPSGSKASRIRKSKVKKIRP